MLNIVVKLIQYTEQAPKLVAIASKTSLSRKPLQQLLDIGEEEVEVWVKETFRRQHFSPWEHASYTFVVDGLSRVASHQLVRHRYASYTQMSHRYTEGYLRALALKASALTKIQCPEKPAESKSEAYTCYSKVVTLALQNSNTEQLLELASIAFVPPVTLLKKTDSMKIWAETVLKTVATYYQLLAQKTQREDARYVLADSVRTRIVVTMNARELIQVFLPLRMCTKAQWEIRYIAWRMWQDLIKVHPQLFKWAGPSCVFRENTIRLEPVEVRKYLEGEEKFTIPRCPELVENKAIPGCLKTGAKVLTL